MILGKLIRAGHVYQFEHGSFHPLERGNMDLVHSRVALLDIVEQGGIIPQHRRLAKIDRSTFDDYELALIDRLVSTWNTAVDDGLKSFVAMMNELNTEVTEETITQLILPHLDDNIGEAFYASDKVRKAVKQNIERSWKSGKVYAAQKVGMLAPEARFIDRQAKEYLTKDTRFWLRHRWDSHIRDRIAKTAKEVGIDQGLGRREVGRAMAQAFKGVCSENPYYWEVVGSAATQRAKTWSHYVTMDQMEFEESTWITMGDERVCFPGYTPVVTPEGIRPIDRIKVGDTVETHLGPRKVEKTVSRDYQGDFTFITDGEHSFVSTCNHPVSTGSGGWIKAKDLCANDKVQLFGNELSEIKAVLNFGLRYVNHKPSILLEASVAPSFFDRIGMPVIAIDFYNDLLVKNGEVGAVSSNLEFLNETNIESLKSFSNHFLKTVFPYGFSVTRETAKFPDVDGTGNYSELLTTLQARFENGRPSAFLRAVIPIDSAISVGGSPVENLSASGTCHIDSVCKPAFSRTDCISIGVTPFDCKSFPADRAYLCNVRSGSDGIIAGFTTVFSFSAISEGLSAVFADKLFRDDGRGMVAFVATELCSSAFCLKFFATFFTNIDHDLHLRTIIYNLSQGLSTTVHNIEVEGAHTYYAGNILVHNCNICGPLDGTVFRVAKAIESIEACMAAKDPFEARNISPWVNWDSKKEKPYTIRYDKDGNITGRSYFASDKLKDGKYLQNNKGVNGPPVHGGCRCDLV